MGRRQQRRWRWWPVVQVEVVDRSARGDADEGAEVGWPRRGCGSGGRARKGIVTPVFPKKIKCLPICMPGSSFIHIVTS
jgi:hypothetical protein